MKKNLPINAHTDMVDTEKRVVRFRKTHAHQSYILDSGEKVKGVTTIINKNLGWNKDVLIAWAKREGLDGRDADAVKRQAADIGSLAHFLSECHVNKWIPDLSDFSEHDQELANNCFDGFLDWVKVNDVRFVDAEKPLKSEYYFYGGTRDYLAFVRNVLGIVDLKSSSGIYADHIIQGAALCMLEFENGDEAAFHEFTENEHYQTFGTVEEEITWLKEKLSPYFLEYHALKLGKTDGTFTPHKFTPKQLITYWVTFKNLLKIEQLRIKIGG
jgi:hypothetical protein